MPEEWRPISGVPEYEVSSEGQVRRLVAGHAQPAGKVIKRRVDTRGYWAVNLFSQGRYRYLQVHRLVLLAFRGDPPTPHHECAHGDGDPLNCALPNLRWATKSENAFDRTKHGNAPGYDKGSLHLGAKLDEARVSEIRDRIARGEKGSILAAEYRVSRPTICDITKGRTWTHI